MGKKDILNWYISILTLGILTLNVSIVTLGILTVHAVKAYLPCLNFSRSIHEYPCTSNNALKELGSLDLVPHALSPGDGKDSQDFKKPSTDAPAWESKQIPEVASRVQDTAAFPGTTKSARRPGINFTRAIGRKTQKPVFYTALGFDSLLYKAPPNAASYASGKGCHTCLRSKNILLAPMCGSGNLLLFSGLALGALNS